VDRRGLVDKVVVVTAVGSSEQDVRVQEGIIVREVVDANEAGMETWRWERERALRDRRSIEWSSEGEAAPEDALEREVLNAAEAMTKD
jgi:hypothetical protein